MLTGEKWLYLLYLDVHKMSLDELVRASEGISPDVNLQKAAAVFLVARLQEMPASEMLQLLDQPSWELSRLLRKIDQTAKTTLIQSQERTNRLMLDDLLQECRNTRMRAQQAQDRSFELASRYSLGNVGH